jgi:hypothetical protein
VREKAARKKFPTRRAEKRDLKNFAASEYSRVDFGLSLHGLASTHLEARCDVHGERLSGKGGRLK